MKITLIRHAQASEPQPNQQDAERTLTELGQNQTQVLKQLFEQLGYKFDHILCSPWLRAKQTAQPLTPLLNQSNASTTKAIQFTSLLTKSPDPEILHLLSRHFAATNIALNIALVGHEPFLSELVSLLLLGSTQHAKQFEFKKAGVSVLDWDGTQARLTTVLDPKTYSALLG